MKSKVLKISIVIFTVLLIFNIITLFNSKKALEQKLSLATSNIKAYANENSSLRQDVIAFQLKVDQLSYYNDSIIDRMNQVRKELDVKDKELKSIQYILSNLSKSDTIVFNDTIFKYPTLNLDTVLGDTWYRINLSLKYPNTITINPNFISEKYIVASYKKETIDPPKKWWILRLFQKKHKVIRVDVVEKNPYIDNKQCKFIEIVK